jgi:hypothetical protein
LKNMAMERYFFSFFLPLFMSYTAPFLSSHAQF